MTGQAQEWRIQVGEYITDGRQAFRLHPTYAEAMRDYLNALERDLVQARAEAEDVAATAHMMGHASRNDEVRALQAEVERLREERDVLRRRWAGSGKARLVGMWEAIHKRDKHLERLVGYWGGESMRTSEHAFIQAFDVLLDAEAQLAIAREALGASREAVDAALRYDTSIAGRAANGTVDLLDSGAGVATGDDLDALYFDWQQKALEARDALHRLQGGGS